MHTVLSSSIGSSGLDNLTITMDETVTFVRANVSDICGARFCPGVGATDNPNLEPPAQLKIQLLSGIFLALMVCACLMVALFTDSLKRLDHIQSS